MTGINYDYINEYIKETISQNDSFLQKLEVYAKENNVPILQPESAKFIYVLTKLIQPKKVLEVGTAIGYSSILTAKALDGHVYIDTLERDPLMAELARKNINDINMNGIINVIEGDALNTILDLKEKYDMIFIDAAKGQYLKFFNNCLDLINENGIIICDNVLFKGMIANDQLVNKKNKTIVNKMREFLDLICKHQQFDTTIIPIGDGISISRKRS